jgi:hypothetical protein
VFQVHLQQGNDSDNHHIVASHPARNFVWKTSMARIASHTPHTKLAEAHGWWNGVDSKESMCPEGR